MNCPYCGKQLSNDASFCSGCGAKINANTINQNNMNQTNAPYQNAQYQNNMNQQNTPIQQANTPNQNNNQFQNMPNAQMQPPKKNKNSLIITIIVSVVVFAIASCVGTLLVTNSKKGKDDDKDSKKTSQTDVTPKYSVTAPDYDLDFDPDLQPDDDYDSDSDDDYGSSDGTYTVEEIADILEQQVAEKYKSIGLNISTDAEDNTIFVELQMTSNINSSYKTSDGLKNLRDQLQSAFSSELSIDRQYCPSLESFTVYIYDEDYNLLSTDTIS